MKEQGFRDVIEITKNPVLVSHSGARAVCNFRQNLTDEQLKLLAENGGVVCLHFYPPIVKGAGATVSDMLDHVDHVASLVGTKHIGLGPDFFPRNDPWLSFINAQGFRGPISFIIDDSSEMRGYSDQEIQGILGGNILRILEKVT
jgi:membrane dipeptidase